MRSEIYRNRGPYPYWFVMICRVYIYGELLCMISSSGPTAVSWHTKSERPKSTNEL